MGALAAVGGGRALAEPATAVPRTMAAAGRPTRGTQTPGFAIGHLGLSWTGEGCGWVRFEDAAGWGSWQPVTAGGCLGSDRPAALIPAGGASAYQVSTSSTAGDVQVVAINTTDGPPADGGGRIRTRADWGADETLRFGSDGAELFPAAFFDVQTLTVHHTDTANGDPDPAATVRAIYFFHTITQKFGDIGYHLLVDEAGTVYEGRFSGPDPTPVFDGDSARMSNGAHVGGFNAGNVGVALLGDLTSAQPTAAAREALVAVLTALATTTRLDPLGTTDYTNPISGATRTVPTIAAHRDWATTACPGDAFFPTLPDLHNDVAARMGSTR